jgi:hypothetical protein
VAFKLEESGGGDGHLRSWRASACAVDFMSTGKNNSSLSKTRNGGDGLVRSGDCRIGKVEGFFFWNFVFDVHIKLVITYYSTSSNVAALVFKADVFSYSVMY